MAWADKVNTVVQNRGSSVFLCARRISSGAIFYAAEKGIFQKIFRRCLAITDLMINEQIRDKEIRLIDEMANSSASCLPETPRKSLTKESWIW